MKNKELFYSENLLKDYQLLDKLSNYTSIKYEEVSHILKERIIIHAGKKDYSGCPVVQISFPPHASPSDPTQPSTTMMPSTLSAMDDISPEVEKDTKQPQNILKALKYFSSILPPETQKLGFTIVIDGRRSKWETLKPVLHILEESFSENINCVHIIKPEKFWQKQKTSLGATKYRFETSMVSLETLGKTCLDPRHLVSPHATDSSISTNHGTVNNCNQLGIPFSFLFDHSDWSDTRSRVASFLQSFSCFIREETCVLKKQLIANYIEKSFFELNDLKDYKNGWMTEVKNGLEECSARNNVINQLPFPTLQIEGQKLSNKLSKHGDTPETKYGHELIAQCLEILEIRKTEIADIYRRSKHRMDVLSKFANLKKEIEHIENWIQKTRENFCQIKMEIGVCSQTASQLLNRFRLFHSNCLNSPLNMDKIYSEADVIQNLNTSKNDNQNFESSSDFHNGRHHMTTASSADIDAGIFPPYLLDYVVRNLESSWKGFTSALHKHSQILELSCAFHLKYEEHGLKLPSLYQYETIMFTQEESEPLEDGVLPNSVIAHPSQQILTFDSDPNCIRDIMVRLQESVDCITAIYLDINKCGKAALSLMSSSSSNNHSKIAPDYSEARVHVIALLTETSRRQNTEIKMALVEDTNEIEHSHVGRMRLRLQTLMSHALFKQDVRHVFEWIKNHGNVFLEKKTGTGRSLARAKALLKNHALFEQIAKNTYTNSRKLLIASGKLLISCDNNPLYDSNHFNRGDNNARINSGGNSVSSIDHIENEAILGIAEELKMAVTLFYTSVKERRQILEISVDFYSRIDEVTTCFKEIIAFFQNFSFAKCLDTVEPTLIDHSKRFGSLLDTSRAVSGMAEELLIYMEKRGLNEQNDHSCSFQSVNNLAQNLASLRTFSSEQWNKHRYKLEITLKFQKFERDVFDVCHQLEYLDEKIRGFCVESAGYSIPPATLARNEFDQVAKMAAYFGGHVIGLANKGKELCRTLDTPIVVYSVENDRQLLAHVDALVKYLDERNYALKRAVDDQRRRLERICYLESLAEECSLSVKSIRSTNSILNSSLVIPTSFSDAEQVERSYEPYKKAIEKIQERVFQVQSKLDGFIDSLQTFLPVSPLQAVVAYSSNSVMNGNQRASTASSSSEGCNSNVLNGGASTNIDRSIDFKNNLAINDDENQVNEFESATPETPRDDTRQKKIQIDSPNTNFDAQNPEEVFKMAIARNCEALNRKLGSEWHSFVSRVTDRHRLVEAGVRFYKNAHQLGRAFDALTRDYSIAFEGPLQAYYDWCPHLKNKTIEADDFIVKADNMTLTADNKNKNHLVSSTAINYIQCKMESSASSADNLRLAIKRHHEQKEAFLKNCTIAREITELFTRNLLRNIQAAHNANDPGLAVDTDLTTHLNNVNKILEQLNDKESQVLEMWTLKKKHMDMCQQYSLFEQSAFQVMLWIENQNNELFDLPELVTPNYLDQQTLLKEYTLLKKRAKETKEKLNLLKRCGECLLTSNPTISNNSNLFEVPINNPSLDITHTTTIPSTNTHKHLIDGCTERVKNQFSSYSQRVDGRLGKLKIRIMETRKREAEKQSAAESMIKSTNDSRPLPSLPPFSLEETDDNIVEDLRQEDQMIIVMRSPVGRGHKMAAISEGQDGDGSEVTKISSIASSSNSSLSSASFKVTGGSGIISAQQQQTTNINTSEGGSSTDNPEKRKSARKKDYIMSELLQTEETYVRDLEACIQHYLKTPFYSYHREVGDIDKKPSIISNTKVKADHKVLPIISVDNLKPLITCLKNKITPPTTISTTALVSAFASVVFCNLEAILKFHRDTFLAELARYRYLPEDVGHCFVKWSHTFYELYVRYCTNKPDSNTLLSKPGIEDSFFRDIQIRSGLALSLSAYLIKPVQRITKYQLLMKELLSCIDSPDSSDQTNEIKDGLDVMSNVPKRANDAMHLSLLQNFSDDLSPPLKDNDISYSQNSSETSIINSDKNSDDVFRKRELNSDDSKRNNLEVRFGQLCLQDGGFRVWDYWTGKSGHSFIRSHGKGKSGGGGGKKERQIFAFETCVLVCKKLVIPNSNTVNIVNSSNASTENGASDIDEGNVLALFGLGHGGTRPAYLFKHKIMMSEVGITEHIEGDECKFSLWQFSASVNSHSNNRRFIFKASCLETKQTWIKKLRELINAFNFFRLTRYPSIISSSPGTVNLTNTPSGKTASISSGYYSSCSSTSLATRVTSDALSISSADNSLSKIRSDILINGISEEITLTPIKPFVGNITCRVSTILNSIPSNFANGEEDRIHGKQQTNSNDIFIPCQLKPIHFQNDSQNNLNQSDLDATEVITQDELPKFHPSDPGLHRSFKVEETDDYTKNAVVFTHKTNDNLRPYDELLTKKACQSPKSQLTSMKKIADDNDEEAYEDVTEIVPTLPEVLSNISSTLTLPPPSTYHLPFFYYDDHHEEEHKIYGSNNEDKSNSYADIQKTESKLEITDEENLDQVITAALSEFSFPPFSSSR
ncbi:unnamed protein product [Gordionus sp. m RMFG-2023]|uniref:triple functional domain protein-like isoform X2 n=1 Tax=Gordionus sp. m RMFG-2023 TaxID=3053472 RepID=UPI0030E147C9